MHYDGGTLLFVTDAQGHLINLKLGALADVSPNGQITVWDRDTSNMINTGHNSTLYYGVAFGGRKFGPYRGGEGPSTIPAGVSPVIFKGSTNAPACTLPNCSLPGIYKYSRLEGFDWGNLTVQGVRAVDNSTGQWTTPDAYAGDVHDPMSQKPFMWDRNNPYEYADPSGYYTQGPIVNGEALLLTPMMDSRVSEIDRQRDRLIAERFAGKILDIVLSGIDPHAGEFKSSDEAKDKWEKHKDDAGMPSNRDKYERKASNLLTAWAYHMKGIESMVQISINGYLALKVWDGKLMGVYNGDARALTLFPVDRASWHNMRKDGWELDPSFWSSRGSG